MSEPPRKRPHPLERLAESAPPASPASPEPAGPRQARGIPLPTTRPMLAPILLVSLVVIFVAQQLDDPALTHRFMKWNDAIIDDGEYYRLFTVMFLHGSIAHLFFNGYALYVIGFTIEGYFGSARFALVYFLGGLLSSIVSLVLTDAPSVGASGALFALLGAEGVFFYQHKDLFGRAGRRHLSNIIFVAAMNLVLGFASAAGSTSGPRIDNWAHMGGLAGGVALALFIAPRLRLQLTEPWAGDPIALDRVRIVDANPLRRSWPAVLLFAAGLALALALAVAG